MLRRFGLACLLILLSGQCASAQTYDIVQERNGLVNVLARMKAGAPVTVAYYGGSITAGAGASNAEKTGWRALTTAWFRRQFPQDKITEVNASIEDAGSDVGAFRLKREVLSKKPDLVFVDFGVNDVGASEDTIQRATEGIVRQIRTADPTTEICFIYALSRDMLSAYKQGNLPPSVFNEDVIAAHYRISAVNVGGAVAQLINSGAMTWDAFSRDTFRPTDAGHAMYADTLTAFLADLLLRISRQPLPYRLVSPLHANCWEHAGLVPASRAMPVPEGWKPAHTEYGDGWPDSLEANPGAAPLTFSFTGDTAGIAFVVGPDAGDMEYRLDDGAWIIITPFDDKAFSGYRLQYRLLSSTLPAGKHLVSIRTRPDSDARSRGNKTRIVFWLTNEPPRP